MIPRYKAFPSWRGDYLFYASNYPIVPLGDGRRFFYSFGSQRGDGDLRNNYYHTHSAAGDGMSRQDFNSPERTGE